VSGVPQVDGLMLLCNTFAKSRVKTRMVDEQTLCDEIAQYSRELGVAHVPAIPLPVLGIRYRYTCALGLRYTYLRLIDESDEPILLVGPYLPTHPSKQQALELGERIGAPLTAQQQLEELLWALPVLEGSNALLTLLDTFYEHALHVPSVSIVDVNDEQAAPASPIHQPLHNDRFDDVLLQMKAMEQRYVFENELIEAVKLGHTHKQMHFFSAITNTNYYEKRVADPVRNTQNYCIIMNTLCRKAAEQGGVHPLYIDRVSSEYAQKIEQLSRTEQSVELMREIFVGYCSLVQQHTLKNYSRTVQTAVLLIDSDLSANLTLHSLAANLDVSAGYLSTVFKQETGQTLTAYIRSRRIQHARHLLRTTTLQIGTIALHCGIPDLHYFSKLFKKETGMTPGQYREQDI
jgi:AraC-like DNA-binding protein